VKLDNPRGDIFGGKTAAPVSKIVLQAALAARDAALDRGSLASRTAADSLEPLTDSAPAMRDTVDDDTLPPLVLALGHPRRALPPPTTPRAIPDVHGLTVRAAAFSLHRAGFRVALDGFGDARASSPAAGTMALPGALVHVSAAP
jgi:cell division protein FtsI (penicillin-binding protein 3)